MRLLGVILTVAAIGWLGEEKRLSLRRRVRSLDLLTDHLTRISGWIDFDHRTLPDMLENMAALPDAAARLFESAGQSMEALGFPQAWRQAVQQHKSALALAAEDEQALLWLGDMLGQFDGETQLQALKKTGRALAHQRQLAWEEWQKKGRVYRTFFWSLGMMAALVLL